MNLSPGDFKLRARDTIAGAAVLSTFCLLALFGLAVLLYGAWLAWRPLGFIAAGLIFLAIGCLGALGRSGSRDDF